MSSTTLDLPMLGNSSNPPPPGHGTSGEWVCLEGLVLPDMEHQGVGSHPPHPDMGYGQQAGGMHPPGMLSC